MDEQKHDGFVPLWKTNDIKSAKSGPRNAVYWVKKNPKYNAKDHQNRSNVAPFQLGNRYKGEWKDNKKHGFGSQVWSCGTKYEGDWECNKRCGKGTLWKPTHGGKGVEKHYSGNWFNNKRHGPGTNFYYDYSYTPDHNSVPKPMETTVVGKAKYEGMWQENKRSGEGTMWYPNGDKYEGNWVGDKRSGLGRFIAQNGDIYEGSWENDMKHGAGKFYYASTHKLYQGEWSENIPKCGEYRDDEQALAQFTHSSMHSDSQTLENGSWESTPVAGNPFTLPVLGLGDPDLVLGSSLNEARRKRYGEKGEQEVHGLGINDDESKFHDRVFSEEEVEHLQDIFADVDVHQTGSIQGQLLEEILLALGLEPEGGEVAQLLQELGVEDERSPITFVEIVGLLTTLKLK